METCSAKIFLVHNQLFGDLQGWALQKPRLIGRIRSQNSLTLGLDLQFFVSAQTANVWLPLWRSP
jgi:hypothetical protein